MEHKLNTASGRKAPVRNGMDRVWIGIPPSGSVETLHCTDAPMFWIKVEVNVPDPSGISPQHRSGCYATASFNGGIMLIVL